ncbi:MAG TPA: glycosyltransferase family 2 protein [Candidatus Mailhella merdigallinarum]|uniref:Glycosyltransferase family 2 protein n=1 Tax=Candidatus Mailhella merdigallinarum TaxID=2838658 RepID=A0A9D2HBR4_9BACT|nr:glycosyltransferase family 2 protein [Candidatus Mailhella merdigallinarum]
MESRDIENIKLSLIIPVYNEVEAIPSFFLKINEVFSSIKAVSIEFVFVNDGSTDQTLNSLLCYQKKDARIRIVDFSRNFGKEAALSAGLRIATGEIVIPLDVDLQDPPELIPMMIEKWRQGYEVVLARRSNRSTDSKFKRITALYFYRIHNLMAQPKLPENVGDFRLLDRRVVDALLSLPESCRFMKGIFAWVGFRTAYIDFVRPERSAGNSKFNGWKLWNFALEGITSFSTLPLRIWTYLGLIIACLAFILGAYVFCQAIFQDIDIPGYASLLITVTFLGGIQLMGIGIIGEYLGRTYLEAKRRPLYIIRHIFEAEKK